MRLKKDNTINIIIVLLIFSAVVLRIVAIPNSNPDMVVYNLPWYQELHERGIDKALGTNFSNYTPPYTYLLALATFTYGLISPLTAIKLIPICFDLLGVIFVYKIVKLKYQHGNLPPLAAAIYFAAPTVILNSAYWGQADSIYTSALLVCLYFLMTEKPLFSMLALGAAFSVKAQAVFLLPFLGVMALRKRIHWLYLGVAPLIYLIAILPVVLLGRPFADALLIYARQSDTFNLLSMNAPNIYNLFRREWYSIVLPFGFAITVVATLVWMYTTWQATAELSGKYIILIAFISTALIPYLLPKMHDRYFYPADVFSILLAFYWPSLWFMPILYQLSSGGAISVFLFNTNSLFPTYGFLLNTLAIAIALRTQRTIEHREVTNQAISSVLPWLAAILVQIVLFGLSLNFLLTPSFIRIEYAMPYMSKTTSLTKSERFQQALQTVVYLGSDQGTRFLKRLKFDNNIPVFNGHEIALLDEAKKSIQNAMAIWYISLAIGVSLSLLAWAENWLPRLCYGISRGGWLAMGLSIILGLTVIINPTSPIESIQSIDTLLQLFPAVFWRDSFLFLCLFTGGSGFLLTRIQNGV
ncbi:MAG: hypothetical protein HZB18_04275 [Chloroflexi bacterium]|nr:hypothetical protein [Chloroflexota bacterium]